MSDDSGGDIELSGRVEDGLKEALLDVQGYCNVAAMARRNPDKWLYIAGELLKGRSRSDICKSNNFDFKGVNLVYDQVMSNPALVDVKRELDVRNVRNLNHTLDLKDMMAEKIKSKFEDGGIFNDMSGIDIIKGYRELSVAAKLETETMMRVRGDAVQRIEVTHKNYDKDDYLEDLKRVDELNRVIEAEEVDE